MKIGIGASNDVEKTVARCKEIGVSSVYISCSSMKGFRENGYPELDCLLRLREGLEKEGIDATSATYWFAKWPDRRFRPGATNPDILLTRNRECIDAMAKMLEVLGKAGVTSILHYIDLGKPDDPSQEDPCWEGLIDIYSELVPIAENHGIGIGTHSLHRLLADGVRERAVDSGVRIEDYNTYRAEGWGGPFLVGTWKELRCLIAAVPSPSNGITLCTGMDIPGGDVVDLVREFGEKIHFCQLRDHTGRWPEGIEVPPGEGTMNLKAIVAALSEVGFSGVVNPEHLGKPRYEGEDLGKVAVGYVRGLLDG